MTFCIISHVIHTAKDGAYFGYGPYIKEMNIWLKYTDKVIVVAPLENRKLDAIHLAYEHPNIEFVPVPHFSFTSVKNSCKALWVMPLIFFKILMAFRKSDHLHLRCPGNMGLLGVVAQIFFPSKIKTAKYAGNWDPNAKQPLTYKWQRSLLANTFLTKRMQVLVYGDWPNQTNNIKAFFTATYPEGLHMPSPIPDLQGKIKLLFVGSLAPGKRPLYAIQLLEALVEKGISAELNLYGEGVLRSELEKYIIANELQHLVVLHGNVDVATMKEVYQQSHFLLLPSQSEGWPKVVAEAMFWGCVPAATPVSCVGSMLDQGSRGVLLTMDVNHDSLAVQELVTNAKKYQMMRESGINWSRQFTTTAFEEAIKKMMMI